MRLIPAILTDKREDFQQKLDAVNDLVSHVQVDIMDGEFVPNTSLFPRSFAYATFSSLTFEAHLMIEGHQWNYLIQSLKTFEACTRIYLHWEAAPDMDTMRWALNLIRRQGQEAGVALNPHTQWEAIVPCLKNLDAVLFMGVEPGFYGSEFQPEVLEHVRSFSQTHGDGITLGWDGGADQTSLPDIVEAGATDVAVGSALFKAENVAEAYAELERIQKPEA
ncbi:MAG: hypothetical protein BRC23_00425 [Parcubacteria group bacterium SW_4_49_11]|nr:MAG: hypothetical protein BRC23_00425 [Parcubacteria group bacterium SW_4_49_11]